MQRTKTIVLCADDFGLNSGVSMGILKLVDLRRISAVSCLVNTPSFALYAQDLIASHQSVNIGLHFNLTEGRFLSQPDRHCFSLNELLIKTHLRLIQSSFIAKEFLAQLDEFMQVMQRAPAFIDGHQHVHQFPGIRQVILELYQQRLGSYGTAVRSTWPILHSPQYQFKAKVLALSGAKALHKDLVNLAIPHNDYFSGIYDFAQNINYRALFKNCLRLALENTLIMCHPGEEDSAVDPIAAARLIELNYFLSEDFVNDCYEHSVNLGLTASPKS